MRATSPESPIPLGEVVLSARGLHHSFGQTEALRGIDLDIKSGEILAIMGPSGSGKSTLLHLMAGVLTPEAGTVEYAGLLISACGEAERARLRLSEFGFVFQFGQLLPDLSALDNVTVPLLLSGQTRRMAVRTAREQLALLGLGEHLNKLPGQLSGGQAQRVAVARAMITSPKILFADEPTGALDSLAAERTMNELTRLAHALATTLVVITHDPRTAAYADRVVSIRDGLVSTESLESVE